MTEIKTTDGLRYDVRHTRPKTLRRHDISDEELTMLCEGREDWSKELLLISIGAFAGSAPNAVEALGYQFSSQPMPILNLVSLVIACGGLFSALALLRVVLVRGDSVKTLQMRIKNRNLFDDHPPTTTT